MVRLTDRPDMTLAVNRGRKTTKQTKTTSNMGNQNISCLFKIFLLPTYLIFILSPYNISSAVIIVIIIFVFNSCLYCLTVIIIFLFSLLCWYILFMVVLLFFLYHIMSRL